MALPFNSATSLVTDMVLEVWPAPIMLVKLAKVVRSTYSLCRVLDEYEGRRPSPFLRSPVFSPVLGIGVSLSRFD